MALPTETLIAASCCAAGVIGLAYVANAYAPEIIEHLRERIRPEPTSDWAASDFGDQPTVNQLFHNGTFTGKGR